jgi:hypothetical protein
MSTDADTAAVVQLAWLGISESVSMRKSARNPSLTMRASRRKAPVAIATMPAIDT